MSNDQEHMVQILIPIPLKFRTMENSNKFISFLESLRIMQVGNVIAFA
jgi:hypothetical protein